ncbi:hypothetical protein CFIMG_007526RA00001 [Ceratocystis fimbriata CBS 114723]|uniref:Uncharacterized protein n=1 Tax=Ceratocystis fimbriata CBS 114723 TaxID=1035309 RepID=A0A2C5WV77_9PEZI|nr:hypothetical protein CFIMG_007526RA00001 [Ceratocystis fimbriata CBS 114723]
MDSNPPSAPDEEAQAAFETFIVSLTQAINSGKVSIAPNSPTPMLIDSMTRHVIKLTEINWKQWSRNMIGKFRVLGILYLFKGLEEDEFRNAVEVEKTDQEKAKDEAYAFGLIRAGLDDDALEYIDNAPTPKRCWTMLRTMYEISLDLQHPRMMSKIIQEMEWKEGDEMFLKWLNIQRMFSEFPGCESMIEETTTSCIITRVIIHLWAEHLPSRIASMLKWHLRTSQGEWIKIMLKIDKELKSIPTHNPSARNLRTPNQR